jgi:glutamine amidotransferase
MIVIVDYQMGNVGSILNMLKRLGAEAIVSSDESLVRKADKLILPGVGAFDRGMRNLNESGLIPALSERVLEQKVPFLGIWIKGQTVRFQFDSQANGHKIPHMGWNTLSVKRSNGLLTNLRDDPRFYFVHSYHVRCDEEEDVLATTFHGYEFPSVLARENILGTQFHPEKSHKFGMQILKNFAEM